MTDPAERFAAGEKPWAFACLISFLGSGVLMIAALVTQASIAVYASGGLALVFLICRWRLQVFEDQKEPDKASRNSLKSQVLFLFGIVLPLYAALIMAARAVRAWIKNEALL